MSKIEVEELSQKYLDVLRDGRNAIIGRGGEIPRDAGFKDLPDAVYKIPADNAITTVLSEGVASAKTVPNYSTPYAYLAEFGGMTYKCKQLNPYPFTFTSYTQSGVTFTANEDQTITISGTATSGASVGVRNTSYPIKAKAGETFTLSTSGAWTGSNGYVSLSQRVNGATVSSISASTTPKTFTVAQDCDLTITVVVVKGNTYNGSIKIMLNRGDTAEPWEPYYEGLRNAKPTEIVSKGIDGNAIVSRSIPAEIQALEGFGEGISVDYYNKVDLVNQKYKKYILTKVLDDKLEWRYNAQDGIDTNYYLAVIGERGVYAERICASSHYENTRLSSLTTGVGIDVYNSAAFGGFVVGIRPENVVDMTLYDFKALIAENPITLKYSLLVPEEYDLPVYMSPLIEVEGGGSIELVNEYDYAVPSKIIYQTLTQ